MRFRNVRFRRPVAIGAAALLTGVAAAVTVASPAMAADLCFNQYATITITSPGNWSGTSGNDVVVIKTNSAATTFDPVGGSDAICILGPAAATIWAAGSGHRINGGPGADTIYGSNGNDTISGFGGNDTIKGNGGSDTIDGDSGNDYIRGNDGDDFIWGQTGDDCLLGGRGYNKLNGDEDNDVILMGYENRYNSSQCAPEDWDTSQAAMDFMNGLYDGGGQATGHSGNDRIWGSNGNDSATGSSGNDAIRTFAGNDSLYGDTGSDTLNGGYGNDTLREYYVDNNADQLIGGPDTDSFSAKSEDICYSGWATGGTISCTQSPPAQG